MQERWARERELVRAAQLGDKQAQVWLYKNNWDRVLNICKRFDQDNAEDLAQDAMVQMFRMLGKYRGEAAVSTWVYRIAVNICLMAKRKAKVRIVEVPDVENEKGQSLILGMQRDEHDYEAAAIARMDLEKVIPALPYGYASQIIARDYMGESILESARRMKVSVGNVKSQTNKGRLVAREVFEGRRKIVENEICQPCKEAGFLDKIAHYRSHLGKDGERVPAKCWYHHLGQTPPWMKEQEQQKRLSRFEEAEKESETAIAVGSAVPCKLKISPDCMRTVPSTKKRQICKRCWAMRVQQYREKGGKKAMVESTAEQMAIEVSAGLIDQTWGLFLPAEKVSAVEKCWKDIPLQLRVRLVEAALLGREKYAAMSASAGSGSVTL